MDINALPLKDQLLELYKQGNTDNAEKAQQLFIETIWPRICAKMRHEARQGRPFITVDLHAELNSNDGALVRRVRGLVCDKARIERLLIEPITTNQKDHEITIKW